MFLLIVLAVLVVLGALAWWTSGRQRRGIDGAKFDIAKAKSQSAVGMHSGRPYGGDGQFPGGLGGPRG